MAASSREDFRRYLEETGVIDSINRVLNNLYDEAEQPANPMDYVKQYLGSPKGVDPQEIKEENEKLEEEIKSLEAQIEAAKAGK